MRVFCPEHKRGFFTPRQSPIKCENRGHILGEFDFQGTAKAPIKIQWQYCCNCEHLCPIDFDREGLEICPVCTRRTSLLFVCDRCFTVSFESNTPLQIKNFTLTSDGAPQPSCPGCLQEASADLREHDCDELRVRFITALNSCPVCLERLDVAPAFPSSVAQYLKKIKAANKLNVTFDYDTELFLPVDDGEFILVNNGSEDPRAVVLPRSTRFASKRDFYELYQDYYHCRLVDAGQVHIIEPAVVEAVGDGWKLQSMGILEIVNDQLKTNAPANNSLSKSDFPVREKPVLSIVTPKEKSPAGPCPECDSLVETGYAFCWNCGNPMISDTDLSKRPDEMIGALDHVGIIDDEQTVQHNLGHIQPSLFSQALPKSSTPVVTMAVVAIGLLLILLGWFALTRSASQLAYSSEARRESANLQPDQRITPSVETTLNASAQADVHVKPTTRPEEEELRKLREKRISASASDRSRILQVFARTEKEYPDDYRFPYERAKLAINGSETRSHNDAFSALSLAAEKAIKADKAQEMLEGLEADKADDFHKLSHGHREWTQVIEALTRKDAALLTAKAEF